MGKPTVKEKMAWNVSQTDNNCHKQKAERYQFIKFDVCLTVHH